MSALGILFHVISGSSPGEKLILNFSRKETDMYRQLFSSITGSRISHEHETIKKDCLQRKCERENYRVQKVTKHL